MRPGQGNDLGDAPANEQQSRDINPGLLLPEGQQVAFRVRMGAVGTASLSWGWSEPRGLHLPSLLKAACGGLGKLSNLNVPLKPGRREREHPSGTKVFCLHFSVAQAPSSPPGLFFSGCPSLMSERYRESGVWLLMNSVQTCEMTVIC